MTDSQKPFVQKNRERIREKIENSEDLISEAINDNPEWKNYFGSIDTDELNAGVNLGKKVLEIIDSRDFTPPIEKLNAQMDEYGEYLEQQYSEHKTKIDGIMNDTNPGLSLLPHSFSVH